MSSASPFRRAAPDVRPVRGVQLLESLVLTPARAAGFWSAVLLPFATLGIVLSGAAVQHAPLLAVLVLANVVALALGHEHKQA